MSKTNLALRKLNKSLQDFKIGFIYTDYVLIRPETVFVQWQLKSKKIFDSAHFSTAIRHIVRLHSSLIQKKMNFKSSDTLFFNFQVTEDLMLMAFNASLVALARVPQDLVTNPAGTQRCFSAHTTLYERYGR